MHIGKEKLQYSFNQLHTVSDTHQVTTAWPTKQPPLFQEYYAIRAAYSIQRSVTQLR
jgi:hypothetical protein